MDRSAQHSLEVRRSPKEILLGYKLQGYKGYKERPQHLWCGI